MRVGRASSRDDDARECVCLWGHERGFRVRNGPAGNSAQISVEYGAGGRISGGWSLCFAVMRLDEKTRRGSVRIGRRRVMYSGKASFLANW